MRRSVSLAVCMLLLAPPVAAEVRFSGDARMGVVRDPGSHGQPGRTDTAAGARIQIDLERETDSGLRFLMTLEVGDSRFPTRGPRD